MSLSYESKASNILSVTDTIIKGKQTEEQIIAEVIKNGTEEQKDKLQYLSKVTKYGFRDLFKNYTYNPLMPYSSQVNPYAENYMQDYLRENTNYLMQLRKTATPYFNLIDNILSQYGLPKELKYLAVIESNLKSTALSTVGARGPWQFMPYTAKDFGLQVNPMVDERVDYYKSTNAAAKYLLTLYKDLHDWLLVIAAYNGGSGRVYEAIKKSGSRNFWSLQYFLPTESRNHVKKFIATHFIMEAGTSSSEPMKALTEDQKKSDSLIVSGKYNSSVIAKYLNMSESNFSNLNSDMNEHLARGESFILRLPPDKMKVFMERKYDILGESVKRLLSDPVKVKSIKSK
ncbi:MAG: hypothetical protein NVSMB45_02830 [Ginsengibacter sp.]